MRNCLVINLDRCTGCDGCVAACKHENGVDLGKLRHDFVAVSFRKASGDDETRTSVLQLDEKGRYEQLALIASGEITKNSLSAARELYRRNQS